MPFSQSDLTSLDAAIKTGTKEVRFQDRTIVYQDLDAMLRARTLLVLELATPPGPQRQLRMVTDKGF